MRSSEPPASAGAPRRVSLRRPFRQACELYERCLQQQPLLHAARTNLIRGLLQRGTAEATARACEHAQASAALQPRDAEAAYTLGVVRMRRSQLAEAAAAQLVETAACPV